jgi:hypothetical protein
MCATVTLGKSARGLLSLRSYQDVPVTAPIPAVARTNVPKAQAQGIFTEEDVFDRV